MRGTPRFAAACSAHRRSLKPEQTFAIEKKALAQHCKQLQATLSAFSRWFFWIYIGSYHEEWNHWNARISLELLIGRAWATEWKFSAQMLPVLSALFGAQSSTRRKQKKMPSVLGHVACMHVTPDHATETNEWAQSTKRKAHESGRVDKVVKFASNNSSSYYETDSL
jgi:hypothetical protein